MGAVGLGHTTGNEKMGHLITAEMWLALCMRAEVHYSSRVIHCLTLILGDDILPPGLGSTTQQCATLAEYNRAQQVIWWNNPLYSSTVFLFASWMSKWTFLSIVLHEGFWQNSEVDSEFTITGPSTCSVSHMYYKWGTQWVKEPLQ